MDVYDFLFSFPFCGGSCAELPVNCQFSLEGYWYILVLACSILYIYIYVCMYVCMYIYVVGSF